MSNRGENILVDNTLRKRGAVLLHYPEASLYECIAKVGVLPRIHCLLRYFPERDLTLDVLGSLRETDIIRRELDEKLHDMKIARCNRCELY